MPEDAEPTPRTGPVLAVFAHPDDAEICAGGAMAKWAATGREVHLLILTNGDRGSGDPTASREQLAATRRRETEAAVEVLGLASARVLSTHDGELENTSILREAVTRRIREVRAETVVSCDPTAVFFENRYYNHSDHRTAGAVEVGHLEHHLVSIWGGDNPLGQSFAHAGEDVGQAGGQVAPLGLETRFAERGLDCSG